MTKQHFSGLTQLFAFAALLGSGCGPDLSTVVEVTITGLPQSARFVEAQATVENQRAKAPASFDRVERFSVQLPAGQRGLLSLKVSGFDNARCLLAEGTGTLQIAGEPRLDLSVALSPHAGCNVPPPNPMPSPWEKIANASNANLRSVFTQAASSIWISGESTTLLQWDGQALTPKDRLGATIDRKSIDRVHGNAQAQFLLLAAPRGRVGSLLRFAAGNTEPTLALSQLSISSFFVLPTGEGQIPIWIAGAGLGRISIPAAGGMVPQISTIDDSQSMHAVWAADAMTAIAVGEGGKAIHSSTADKGVTKDLPQKSPLYAIHGTGPSSAWAGGAEGTLLAWNDTTWTALVTGTRATLRGVFADPENVWAVGDAGTILRCPTAKLGMAAKPCMPETSGVAVNLYAIAGIGQERWAVGDGGTVLRLRLPAMMAGD